MRLRGSSANSFRAAGGLRFGNALSGTIAEIGYRGDVSLYKARLADRSLIKVARANVSSNGDAPFAVGDVVWVTWPLEAGVVLRE